MKFLRKWKYYAYRVYAELACRYYAYKDCNKPNPPPKVCQICGKPGHIERLCPNAWRMDFLKLNKLVPVPHNFPYFYRLFGYEMR